MASSSTHPPSAYSHQPTLTLAEFQRELTKACNYSLPSPNSKQYRQIKVLLLHWDTTPLSPNLRKQETEQLAETFRHTYHYNCEIDNIPAQGALDPQLWLNKRLVRWADGTDQRDLLILYYSGDGRRDIYKPEDGHWMMV